MIAFLDLTKRNARYEDAFAAAVKHAIHKPLILGEQVDRFERGWSIYCDKKYGVGVGNGYDGLVLMLRAIGIHPGCRVVVQTNAHVSAWLAVDAVGAQIVPVEPDPDNYQIDLERLTSILSTGIDAVLVTFMYGRIPDIATLTKVSRASGAHLLVDASHAHGAHGVFLGDAATFSLYPTKNLGALGDAGIVVTNSQRIAHRIRDFRNYGSVTKNTHSLRYGSNSRLDELQAAFLNIKLSQLDSDNQRRNQIARTYYRALRQLPPTAPHMHHLFVLRSHDRAQAQATLAAQGIETARYYPIPPHRQDAFAHLSYGAGSFVIAEQLAAECFCIPNGPELTDEEVIYVAEQLRKLVQEEVLV